MPSIIARPTRCPDAVGCSSLSLSGSLTAACLSDECFNGGSLVLRRKVRISERHRKRFVPQQLTNGIEVNARHHELARERVAQIVKAERAYLRGLQNGHPWLLDRREWRR